MPRSLKKGPFVDSHREVQAERSGARSGRRPRSKKGRV